MDHKKVVPQRVITVSVVGIEHDAHVFYSYTSPVTGKTFFNVPVCDISIDQETYTMYVLDFAASMNGWTFTGMEPRDDVRPLIPVLAANSLSITTLNPYDRDFPRHAYYLEYCNTLTGKKMKHDPQENNVPPPG